PYPLVARVRRILPLSCCCSFFSHAPATPPIYTLSLHDALPISFSAGLEKVLYLKAFLRDLGWPAVCGLLLALLLVQQFPQLVGLPAAKSGVPGTPAIVAPVGVVSYGDAVSHAAPSVANIFTIKQIRNGARSSGLNGQILGDYGTPIPEPSRRQSSLGSAVILRE